MRGRGVAFGAATVLNAMPSGFGAALGVGLRTFADVEITEDPAVTVEIEKDESEGKGLAEECFKAVLERFRLKFGGKIRTVSEIPIARGMKSSSAAANAIVLATLEALDENLDDFEIINLGVEASLRAGVTVTGAFDDACASYLGMIHVTDNYRRKILRSYDVEPLSVLFLVPDERRYSGEVDLDRVRSAKGLAEMPFREAMDGRYWQAMLLNGLMMAQVFHVNPSPIITAMQNGAVTAGLCGKGPAICAISRRGDEGKIVDGWNEGGQTILRSEVNGIHAHRGGPP
jgi:shikimate kinase